MKIAVLSDTHWDFWRPQDPTAHRLMELLDDGFEEIWHAGDVVEDSVLDALEQVAPVVCVKGNCDAFLGRYLPHSVTETREGVKLGMIHGWDLPLDHCATLVSRFADDVDVIIHGHTHRRRFQQWSRPDGGKVTVINPGSVTSPRGGETAGMGVLTITDGRWQYTTLTL